MRRRRWLGRWMGKLIVLYDDNLISLDGPTSLSYTEDVTSRFERTTAGAERGRWQRPGAIEDASKARRRTRRGRHDPGAHGDWVWKPEGRDDKAPALEPRRRGRPRRTWAGPRTRILCAGRGAGELAHDQAEGQEAARGVGRELCEYKKAYPEPARSSSALLRAAGRGLGEVDSDLPVGAGCQEGGDAHRWKCGDQRNREGGAGAVWRRGRYIGFDQDEHQWLAQLPCGCGGTEHLLWRARVRHDGDVERNRSARRADSVWVDVLRLLGLLQAAIRLAR